MKWKIKEIEEDKISLILWKRDIDEKFNIIIPKNVITHGVEYILKIQLIQAIKKLFKDNFNPYKDIDIEEVFKEIKKYGEF